MSSSVEDGGSEEGEVRKNCPPKASLMAPDPPRATPMGPARDRNEVPDHLDASFFRSLGRRIGLDGLPNKDTPGTAGLGYYLVIIWRQLHTVSYDSSTLIQRCNVSSQARQMLALLSPLGKQDWTESSTNTRYEFKM
jgi:hypothetical protein